MLREMNSITDRGSSRTIRKHEPALRATCLLCRVLWPIVVQHRHLFLDWPAEAKTLFVTQKQPE
jgi:hypothetical protein